MKISGNNVPPALDGLFKSLVSVTAIGANAGEEARTQKSVRISKSKKVRKPDETGLEKAVDALIKYMNDEKLFMGDIPKKETVLEQLKMGYFNEEYWKRCEISESEYYKAIPTSVIDPDPPPYGYVDQYNLPSLPLYGYGDPDDWPARYAGETVAGIFMDKELTWEKTSAKLVTPITLGKYEPLLIRIRGEIHASTNNRGSRPMLSLLVRGYIASDGHSMHADRRPPIGKIDLPGFGNIRNVKQFYWRYVVPSGIKPYWEITQERYVTYSFNNLASIEAGTKCKKATIVIAPRPMFGRGFNNNTIVNTEWDGIVQFWQIKPALKVKSGFLARYYTLSKFGNRNQCKENFISFYYSFNDSQGIAAKGGANEYGKKYLLITVGSQYTPDLEAGLMKYTEWIAPWENLTIYPYGATIAYVIKKEFPYPPPASGYEAAIEFVIKDNIGYKYDTFTIKSDGSVLETKMHVELTDFLILVSNGIFQPFYIKRLNQYWKWECHAWQGIYMTIVSKDGVFIEQREITNYLNINGINNTILVNDSIYAFGNVYEDNIAVLMLSKVTDYEAIKICSVPETRNARRVGYFNDEIYVYFDGYTNPGYAFDLFGNHRLVKNNYDTTEFTLNYYLLQYVDGEIPDDELEI